MSVVHTVPVALPDAVPASILLDVDDDNRLIGIEAIGTAAVLPERPLDAPSSAPSDITQQGSPPKGAVHNDPLPCAELLKENTCDRW